MPLPEVPLMLSRIFNHSRLLEKGLDVAWLKNEVISQNIANVDTPGYDRRHVEFDEAFANALKGNHPIVTRVTREQHFRIPETDPMRVRPVVVSSNHYVMRMDDNNVDIDKEMVDLAKNTIQYNALVQKLSKEFQRLKLAVREGR
jgi:flagellar basal-body rod protein FlgB